MLAKLFKPFSRSFIQLVLGVFLFISFLGVYDCMNRFMQGGMEMQVSGHRMNMTDCTPGKNCGMGINEHLSIWQSTFVMNFSTYSSNFFVALLILGFAIGIFKILFSPEISPSLVRYRYYERDHRDSMLYNYLLYIFARGIIQPKLYA